MNNVDEPSVFRTASPMICSVKVAEKHVVVSRSTESNSELIDSELHRCRPKQPLNLQANSLLPM